MKHDEVNNLIEHEIFANATQFAIALYEQCGQFLPDDFYSTKDDDEILQFWIVSEWLARKLIQNGKEVKLLYGIYFWGRTTAGMALEDEEVLQQIAEQIS
jgi:hypothetical protein